MSGRRSPATSRCSRTCCSPSGSPCSRGGRAVQPPCIRSSTCSTPACTGRFAPGGPWIGPRRSRARRSRGSSPSTCGAWIAYTDRRYELFYWRTRSGVEVDFVVYGAGGFWAIEVQNSRRLRPQDLRGIETFLQDYPQCEGMLLHRGEERARVGRIWCVPVQDFLRGLHPGRGLTAWLRDRPSKRTVLWDRNGAT